MGVVLTTVFGSLTQEDEDPLALNARTYLNKQTNKTNRKQERFQEYIKCHFFFVDK